MCRIWNCINKRAEIFSSFLLYFSLSLLVLRGSSPLICTDPRKPFSANFFVLDFIHKKLIVIMKSQHIKGWNFRLLSVDKNILILWEIQQNRCPPLPLTYEEEKTHSFKLLENYSFRIVTFSVVFICVKHYYFSSLRFAFLMAPRKKTRTFEAGCWKYR